MNEDDEEELETLDVFWQQTPVSEQTSMVCSGVHSKKSTQEESSGQADCSLEEMLLSLEALEPLLQQTLSNEQASPVLSGVQSKKYLQEDPDGQLLLVTLEDKLLVLELTDEREETAELASEELALNPELAEPERLLLTLEPAEKLEETEELETLDVFWQQTSSDEHSPTV